MTYDHDQLDDRSFWRSTSSQLGLSIGQKICKDRAIMTSQQWCIIQEPTLNEAFLAISGHNAREIDRKRQPKKKDQHFHRPTTSTCLSPPSFAHGARTEPVRGGTGSHGEL